MQRVRGHTTRLGRQSNKNSKGLRLVKRAEAAQRTSSDEERVALAVLVQGVRDIVENNQKYVDYYDPEWGRQRCVDQALYFFADEVVDIGSYAWYCEIVGIDPNHIRKAINTGNWDALVAFSKVNVH